MLFTLFTGILSLVVTSLLTFGWVLYSTQLVSKREKLTAFECGFDPSGSARTPFSLRFFLLAVIFLVFDIEIVLLMPLPLMMTTGNSLTIIVGLFLFLLILLIGTMHEYNEGSLDWAE
uniref:NADH-ubiquinone oxidoreductase chain 3 n=1 Tax=Lumbriclymenella robusta TaxID=3138170 RepID=A0AB38ZG05_9ANNE